MEVVFNNVLKDIIKIRVFLDVYNVQENVRNALISKFVQVVNKNIF